MDEIANPLMKQLLRQEGVLGMALSKSEMKAFLKAQIYSK